MSALHRVFVSYSRRDQEWVDELADALETTGIPVWIDRRSIPVSLPWLEELEHAIVTSTLFLVCRSPRWESSHHCAAESRTAEALRKERVEVAVGEAVSDAAERIAAAAQGISATARAHTSLQARAYQWDDQGRPRPLLPGLRERRRLERSVGPDRVSTVVERDFLAASRARSRKWRRIATWIAALPLVPVMLTGVLEFLEDLGSVQAFAVTTIDSVLEQTERSPYVGLQMASGLGFAETALNAEALHMALNRPVPDDRIVVDARVTGFATPVLHEVVALSADDGRIWVRSLDDDVREATVVDGPTAGRGSPRALHGLAVEIVSGTATVTVDRSGHHYRTLVAGGPVSAATISPDGRTIAVAVHRVVHLFDLELGQRRVDLRGLPATAVGLAFTSDGSRLFAAIDDGAVGWTVRTGTRLLDEPDQRYEAVLPSADDGRVWLVDRTHGLRLIDVATGEEARRIGLEDDVYGATADRQGRLAAVHLLDRIGIVDLRTGAIQVVTIEGCSIATPVVYADATQVLVPCRGGALVVVDAVDAHELNRLPPPAENVTAVGVAADTGEVFLGSQDGMIHGPVNGDSDSWQLRCRAEVVAIAVADDGGLTVPSGIGTGATGCTARRIVDAEGDAFWHSFADLARTATMARAAAIIEDRSAFAIGYDDGTVRLRPAANLEPHHRFDEVHGTVTGLLALPGTHQVLVATRAGVLHSLPTVGIPLTNAEAAVEAEGRLNRARELGLTDLVPFEDSEDREVAAGPPLVRRSALDD